MCGRQQGGDGKKATRDTAQQAKDQVRSALDVAMQCRACTSKNELKSGPQRPDVSVCVVARWLGGRDPEGT